MYVLSSRLTFHTNVKTQLKWLNGGFSKLFFLPVFYWYLYFLLDLDDKVKVTIFDGHFVSAIAVGPLFCWQWLGWVQQHFCNTGIGNALRWIWKIFEWILHLINPQQSLFVMDGSNQLNASSIEDCQPLKYGVQPYGDERNCHIKTDYFFTGLMRVDLLKF